MEHDYTMDQIREVATFALEVMGKQMGAALVLDAMAEGKPFDGYSVEHIAAAGAFLEALQNLLDDADRLALQVATARDRINHYLEIHPRT